MNIDILKVGSYECNCYILIIDNNCLIIDPGDEYHKIINEIKDKNILGVLITHHHFDHIGSLQELIDNYKVPVYDNTNTEEKEYKIKDFKFKVIFTPGHTTDSISFLFDNYLFCGDFIFKDNIGRCDLPTGNYNIMKESINKIKQYNDNIIIYPGHGDKTTLLHEKENNIYFGDNYE